ncbi:hypothetical protein PENANT_c021G10333 [Penicillium antarcticum]|uniref:NAD-dependent epimerase/dehydratase domain-containing protein n=1 Tax=Penicillium antarcticum TaxID=416450 RepID=A0A1V6PZL4_9EURO|nr:uncharacterized protein N7508_010984 [Penicillium antarcticum]KAJ5296163.1 hypothetical protein N7508_010984 [Penicillium antarcticum]OQD82413.1 hypothetical protein PENANT_c021G10333 [Penicillium antarcticum]
MSRGLIFITGATGFIGSATAVEALKAGYKVRLCLRKPSEQLQSVLSEYSNQVEYVIVPDLTSETAFNGKLNDVDYIFHLASPLVHGTNKETYFTPAVKATTYLLKAAAKIPSIKKVVVTSSVAALMPMTGVPAGGVIKEDNDWDFSVDENGSFENPENPAATPMRLYQASKLLANKATWDFRATTKPHFALVTLHPVFVWGHNPMQTSAEEVAAGSNGLLWSLIMQNNGAASRGVHIQDVAEAHVKVLDPKIPDGSKYLLAGPSETGPAITSIVKRLYPDSGAKITEDIQLASSPLDTTKAERELGIKWRSYETMITDVMDQQLGFYHKL